MNINDRPVTSGPIFTFWKISDGHNSAMRNLIAFMFGSWVGFSGSADRSALFPVGSNLRRQLVAILKNLNGHIPAVH